MLFGNYWKMKSKAKWIGEGDPLNRTVVVRKGEIAKIINKVIVNSKLDVEHQIDIFGNSQSQTHIGHH